VFKLLFQKTKKSFKHSTETNYSALLNTPNNRHYQLNMKSISVEKIYNIKHLLQQGKSYREISIVTGVSCGSISKIKKQNCPELPIKQGGRPKLLTDRNNMLLVRKLTSGAIETATEGARFLERITNQLISRFTAARAMHEAGLEPRKRIKRPALSSRHKKLRLEFARRYQFWTPEDWKKVIWSDETKINRFGSDGKIWYWKRSNDNRILDHHVAQTYKYGGGSLMVWACMTYEGVGFMEKIDGKMDAALYLDIISCDIARTCEWYQMNLDQVIFQQDNAPCHTSGMVREWLQTQDFEVLDWPPQSPDLNPIEHTWAILKKKLGEYEEQPASIHELWDRVQTQWELISRQQCQNLVDSMPNRIDAVIRAKGGFTNY
jgi:transposase